MKLYKKFFPFCLAVTVSLSFLLGACEQAARINNTVQTNEAEIESALTRISPDEVAQRSPLTVVNSPWYGAEAVAMNNGSSLPQELTSENAVTVTFTGQENLRQTARKLESVSGIPIRYSQNMFAEGNAGVVNATFLPAGGQEVSGGRIVWSGSMQNILNQMANQYGFEWEYQGGAIRFISEATRTFMLNALAGELSVSGSATSSSGGTSSSLPQISVDGNSTLEIWGEISETINTMIGQEGRASFSPSTGTVTVTASPSVLRRVENYLRYQNEMRLRRIAVSVKVLSVSTSDSASVGFELGGIIKGALGEDLTVASTQSSDNVLDATILKNPVFTDDGGLTSSVGVDPSNIIDQAAGDVVSALQADKDVERVSVVHSGSLVTLSDQPAPLQVGRQVAYVERISSTGGETSSVSIEPGVIDLGLFMTVLPRIVEDDRILMRLSMGYHRCG